MSKAFLALGIVVLGLITFAMVNVIQDYSTGNDLDYYLLKETTKGSMEDAIDLNFYRIHGIVRMDKEKFVESFAKRFANNVQARSKKYTISFYDINETPPKVSVKVKTATAARFNNDAIDIENRLDAIVESVYTEDMIIENVCGDANIGSNVKGKYNICDYSTITDDNYYQIIN